MRIEILLDRYTIDRQTLHRWADRHQTARTIDTSKMERQTRYRWTDMHGTDDKIDTRQVDIRQRVGKTRDRWTETHQTDGHIDTRQMDRQILDRWTLGQNRKKLSLKNFRLSLCPS